MFETYCMNSMVLVVCGFMCRPVAAHKTLCARPVDSTSIRTHTHTRTARLAAAAALFALAGCTAGAPLAVMPASDLGVASAHRLGVGGTGDLVVYSATFVPTLEEGEYPAHTDYTIATTADKVIEHVTNRTGSFDERPAKVNLASGEYHIRAQYSGGGFVIVPVLIAIGKTTTIDLDGRPMPVGQSADGPADPIQLPGGRVVGWRAIGSN
jgi:hypothetical protein